MSELGEWVLTQACTEARAWADASWGAALRERQHLDPTAGGPRLHPPLRARSEPLRPRAVAAQGRDHRERAGQRDHARPAATRGHPRNGRRCVPRRLRHRVLVARLHPRAAARRGQARPRLHARPGRVGGRLGARTGGRDDDRTARAGDDRRGARDGGAPRPAALARLSRRPGLLLREARGWRIRCSSSSWGGRRREPRPDGADPAARG